LKAVFKNKPEPTASWNTWNSFISGRTAHIQDLRAGVDLGNTLTIGLGYHWLQSDKSEVISLSGLNQLGQLKFRYWAPYTNYAFYRKGHWEARIDLQLGIGRAFLKMPDNEHVLSRSIFLYESSINLEYQIMGIIGLDLGYGYRVMLKNNRALHQQFTAPVYVFGVSLIFEELYLRYNKWRERKSEE
jgi:hypothetical protein